MSTRNKDVRIAELRRRLAELDARFHTEVQKRGFDPAQIGNMALPSALAKLFAECAEVKSALEELASED
jgi:hypothetical protein